jgi:hypothetical protein
MLLEFILPPGSFESMCDQVAESFRRLARSRSDVRSTVRMVGLLFARPTTAFAASEIVPNLSYFHQRSGAYIDVFCAGFHIGWDVSRLAERDLVASYSDSEFDRFRQDIERRSKWRYSGEADLLLLNARFDGTEVQLDFASAVFVDLLRARRDNAIESVSTLFESIFRYAENHGGTDPTWGFSDSAAKQIGGSALKNLLISLLPQGLQQDARKAFHFAVHDLSP